MKSIAIVGIIGCWSLALVCDAICQDKFGLAGPTHQELTSEEWTGIQAAHAASRHAAYPAGSGYRALNPGQRFESCFDGRGFTVEPHTGSWSWGLELAWYGFGGIQAPVESPERVHSQGGRVSYDWDALLTEWFINDMRGLEHGYTVQRRPGASPAEEADELLTIALRVRGALEPEVAGNGSDIRFVDDAGAAVIAYSGLTAYDADGRTLAAKFEAVSGRLLLIVETHDAHYPLTIDPVVQRAYLKASNPETRDWFWDVAISGDTVVVGAQKEDSSASGVNGNQNDNSLRNSGAAYVFVRSGGVWSQQAYLKASNPDREDRFGAVVAISGDTIVVGASCEDSGATGVNGSQGNDSSSAGAVYVFVRTGSTWTQEAYIKASNTGQTDGFGSEVAICGDILVVGALSEDSDATGVDGDQDNDASGNSGAAYVFLRTGSTWVQEAYLKASNTQANDGFGALIALSGDTIVVGAPFEDSGATGVNGDQMDNSVLESGAAYVFVRSGASWIQQAYLKASNTGINDAFGISVAVSGDTILIGAPGENSSATGVNGDQGDNTAFNAGAAYVFVRNGSVWTQEAYLKASKTGTGDFFGGSVALGGDMAVIGAQGEDSSATGVNGDQNNDGASRSGAAYVFRRNGSGWRQTEYLKASNTDPGDNFGIVGLSGDTAIVSAPDEDSDAAGVNGDQHNNDLGNSGAVYVFDLDPTGWFDMGNALAGVFGDPQFAGTGPLTGGSSNAVVLFNAERFASAGLFVALSSTPVPFKGGTLMPFPWVDMPILQTTSFAGTITIQFTVPTGVPVRTELWFQWAILDPAAIAGVALSNALLGVTP